MNEEIDVGEIIRLTQTDFNFSFSFDVSRMQNLFEQLCINVQKLQNEIFNLKKDIQNKADKTELDPLNNTITQNGESIDNLNDRIDKLNDICSGKLGTPAINSDLQNGESDSKDSELPQSRPRSSINNNEANEFNERITKCEDKIADFDKRFDELSKFLLSDLPNSNNAQKSKNYVGGPTRHERFEGLLEEFDAVNKIDGAIPSEEKDRNGDFEANNEAETEQGQESNSKMNSEPEKSISRHDDTLDTFLDAAKIEIENAKKLLSDELGQQIKENNAKLNTSITKTAADSEDGLKKANTKLVEAEVKLGTEIKAMSTDNQRQFQQLRENLENLTNKIKALESRLESSTKASEMTKDSLKKLVTDDGKIDPDQLFDQLEQHLILINDMDGRLVALENRELVSPDSFNTALANLSECTEKVKKVESMIVSTDMYQSELKEAVDELKKAIGDQITHDQFNEIEKIIKELQEESSNLRDAIIKNNKDIVNVRAAINTLRGNSEETRSIAEDAKYSAKQAVEEAQGNDKRLKKMVVFMKEETGQLSSQIKELSTTAERHDELITELQRKHDEDISRLEALKSEEESDEESDEDATPRQKTAKGKQQQQVIQPVSTVSAATSPHLPSLSASNFDQAEGQLNTSQALPNLQSQQQQQQRQSDQQSNMDQSIVSVVRKKQGANEATTTTNSAVVTGVSQQQRSKRVVSGGLPRLVQQQAKREIEGVRMDLKRYEDLIPRVERLESSLSLLRSIVDPLNKQVKILTDQKADRNELQNLFEQFRMALGELNNRMGGIRKIVASKADIAELKDVQRALFKELMQTGETAAGTETVRCLMCGQPRTNVTGAIDDPTLAKAIGNAMSSRVCGADGQGNVCFVYGEHGEMFMGRSADGRPIYSRQVNSEDENGRTNNAKQSQAAPMTAPMMARKVLDNPNSQ